MLFASFTAFGQGSSRSEETAELVRDHGGSGIAIRVDHTVEQEVQALFKRVGEEHGRLDILVNDVWGGDELSEWGVPLWELSIEKGLLMQQRAVHSHMITSRYAAPLMVARRQVLIVEITDGDTARYRGIGLRQSRHILLPGP